MIENIDFYYPYTNGIVTDKYFSVILGAFKKLGINYSKIESFDRKSSSSILVAAVQDATRAKKAGYKQVFLWLQGIIPEESYLRNHSKLRRGILSFLENKGLNKADFVFYVSNAMREHFKTKYGYDNDHFYIMPCFNDELHKEAFFADGKYRNNVFLYAGSLDAWQCFRETATLYARIEQKVENCSFRVLTKDGETAKKIIEEQGIQNYSLDYVPSDQIGKEMEKAKFGFSIRKDDPVNRVATPTKLSTYVSYGVMPIYSHCLQGFDETAHDNQFCICIDRDENAFSKLVDMCYTDADPDEVYRQMEDTFGEYYSSSYHIEQIAEVLREWLL